MFKPRRRRSYYNGIGYIHVDNEETENYGLEYVLRKLNISDEVVLDLLCLKDTNNKRVLLKQWETGLILPSNEYLEILSKRFNISIELLTKWLTSEEIEAINSCIKSYNPSNETKLIELKSENIIEDKREGWLKSLSVGEMVIISYSFTNNHLMKKITEITDEGHIKIGKQIFNELGNGINYLKSPSKLMQPTLENIKRIEKQELIKKIKLTNWSILDMEILQQIAKDLDIL